jgi:hypothetical protein
MNFPSPVRTYAEQYNPPGSALYQAWRSGLIDRNQYEAGRRLATLWHEAGSKEQSARLAAARAILSLGEQVAYVVASVCRDNSGVGNPHRASLLKAGLSRLALHLDQTGGLQ